jgi:integrase
MTRAAAKAKAKKLTALAYAEGGALADTPAQPTEGETFAEWAKRWCKSREDRGIGYVRDNRSHLEHWINPVIGPRPIRSITRRDLEALVEALDEAVRQNRIEWKSATNFWGTVSKAFDDATNAKVLSLRVLETNPAAGIRGPDRGANKAKAYLYPSEFLTLATAERVPLRWRRIYALSVYTYTRASELMALDWADVDFQGGLIRITKALDKKGAVKPTKTKETRNIPIEPGLLPLLEAMHGEADGKGRIVSLPRKKMAAELREHLQRAGITRPELLTSTATRKALTFHDGGRATGITWMAIRGDDPLKIMRRAGHTDLETTMLYIREAETLGRSVGEPFPALPASLLSSGDGPPSKPTGREGILPVISAQTGPPSGPTRRTDSRIFSGVDGTRTSQVSETAADSPKDRVSQAARSERSVTSNSANAGSRAETPGGKSDPSTPPADPVEEALAAALERAAAAGQWGTVELLARELGARRDASSPANVVPLHRSRREGS